MAERKDEEGIIEKTVARVAGVIRVQIMESQVMKAGFYLVGNGESLLVYEIGSHMMKLIWE